MSVNRDEYWMSQALSLAVRAEREGEVPVGAVVVSDDQLIAASHNQPISACDPSAHAEVMVLREAGRVLKNYRLVGTTLYVTLEPCAMCVGALLQARVKHLVFGAFDARAGAVSSVFKLLSEKSLNHRISWEGGVLAQECRLLLQNFFRKRR